MSLLGKFLAILNLGALLGFLYFLAGSYQKRQEWTYAVLRWDIALDGLPMDEAETDKLGKPRHLLLNDALCKDLLDDGSIRTQEQFVDKRLEELFRRVDDGQVPGSKSEKLADILLALASTAGERERLIAGKVDKSEAKASTLRKDIETKFADAVKVEDRDLKRAAIASLLVRTLDLLPTPDEKKKRAEAVAKNEDILAERSYQTTTNAVGVRQMSNALEQHARDLLAMSSTVAEVRTQERAGFVYQHQMIVELLVQRHEQLIDQKKKLERIKAQADAQKTRADQQKLEVDARAEELEKKRKEHDRILDNMEREQQINARLLVRLRDANANNQKMEALIRRLEIELESENP